MTNFEMLMKCKSPEHFVNLYHNILKLGCRQKTKEDWKKYCLDTYRGYEGCKKCTLDYLNSEFVDF